MTEADMRRRAHMAAIALRIAAEELETFSTTPMTVRTQLKDALVVAELAVEVMKKLCRSGR